MRNDKVTISNKTNRLKIAIWLFILLDLSLLGINFWITNKVCEDATAINLAGRERMLSQRVTKVLLQLDEETPIQERTQLEKELRTSLSLFYTTLSAFAHSGMTTDGDGSPVYLKAATSAAAQESIQQTQILAKPLHDQLHPYLTSNDPFPNHIIEQARDYAVTHNQSVLKQMNALTTALQHESQHRTNMMRVLQSIIFIMALINFIGIIRGMGQQTEKAVAMSQYFSELAIRDPLTGLFNRRQFNDSIAQAAQIDNIIEGLALIMIDLDGFKPINDHYGHDAGDDVLREIGRRLETHARASDTLARLGGDEFALLCANLTNDTASLLCQSLVDEISRPIQLGSGQNISISASIGIAFYSDHINDMDEFLQAADKAMYQAKTMGRGRYVCAGETDETASQSS